MKFLNGDYEKVVILTLVLNEEDIDKNGEVNYYNFKYYKHAYKLSVYDTAKADQTLVNKSILEDISIRLF
jgi:hypothetical protein